jgi:hypothetical protein
MNRKQLILLLILVLALGGLALLYYQRHAASWQPAGQNAGQKVLGEFPVNDVAQLLIRQGTNTLTLHKQADLWRVRERHKYPANFNTLSELLLKLRDLKIVQAEPVSPHQLARLDLLPPESPTNAATLVEFYDKANKRLAALWLGKKHLRKPAQPSRFGDEEGWPDGRWLKRPESDTVALVSDPLGNLEPKPADWLDRAFFRIEKPRTIAVDFPQATNSWRLTRESESGEWKLADAKPAEQLDTGKASAVTHPFTAPSFVDVLPGATPAEMTGLDQPTTITVETFDQFTYTIRVGRKTNDNYHLTVAVQADLPKERVAAADEKPEDKERLDKEFADNQAKRAEKLQTEQAYRDWVYLVSSWQVDSLLKERAQLLAEKKEAETKPADTPTESEPEPAPESAEKPGQADSHQ